MRRGWMVDESPDETAWTYDNVQRAGFWGLVDSANTIHSQHRGPCRTVDSLHGEITACHDWLHVRGDGCMAAKSDRERCNRPILDGVPFCDFHFGDAWAAMRAFVNQSREHRMGTVRQVEHERHLAEAQMDVAMVRDARRVLALSEERVYFFAVGDYVKIGRSIHPERRVKTLAGTKAPEGVDCRTGSLLGTIPGSAHVESQLHRQFAYCRLVGEWFDLAEIRDDINALIAKHDTSGQDVAA